MYLGVLQDEHRLHLQETLMSQSMPQLSAIVERHDVFKLQLQAFHELIGKVGRLLYAPPMPGVFIIMYSLLCYLLYTYDLDQFLG